MKSTRRVLLLVSVMLAVVVSVSVSAFVGESRAAEPGWISLFDGKTLRGWTTWLGGADNGKVAPGAKPAPPIGANKDDRHVFSVVTVDGAPAIRISGEIFGAITSDAEVSDFHLRAEVKWGQKRWSPRQDARRDSGILYRAVGPEGAQDGRWMSSIECQVQEHDMGDLWCVAGVIADVEGREPPGNKSHAVTYEKGAPTFPIAFGLPHERARHGDDTEKAYGDWNTVEVMCVGPRCVHIINGQVVMDIANPRRPGAQGTPVPLVAGHLQLQSEGAEVFYRNIAVRPLHAFPANVP